MQAIRSASGLWAFLRQWLCTQVLPSLQKTVRPAASGSGSGFRAGRPVMARWRTMHITVACAQAASLRRIVMQCCGDGVRCMQLEPLDHAQRMRLCLRLPAPAAVRLMDVVMAALPQAEFSLWQRR